jgi:hypothetical protein
MMIGFVNLWVKGCRSSVGRADALKYGSRTGMGSERVLHVIK